MGTDLDVATATQAGPDERTPVPDDELGDSIRHGDETRERASTNQPLNAPKPRPTWRPLLYLFLFIAALVLIYLFGLTVLVPSG